MVRGVANVWVPVEDIQRALDFYQNASGFSVIKRDGPWDEVPCCARSSRTYTTR